MKFDDLDGLARHLLMVSELKAMEDAMQPGLELCAKRIEKTAKSEIGHYQAAHDPFPAWDPLAESTENEKARLGYPTNAPLLRTGHLRDSITHEVHGLTAVIGSTDPVMQYHEFGTSKMPPRPVMGPAAVQNKEYITKTIGSAAISGLFYGHQIHEALGYNEDLS